MLQVSNARFLQRPKAVLDRYQELMNAQKDRMSPAHMVRF